MRIGHLGPLPVVEMHDGGMPLALVALNGVAYVAAAAVVLAVLGGIAAAARALGRGARRGAGR